MSIAEYVLALLVISAFFPSIEGLRVFDCGHKRPVISLLRTDLSFAPKSLRMTSDDDYPSDSDYSSNLGGKEYDVNGTGRVGVESSELKSRLLSLAANSSRGQKNMDENSEIYRIISSLEESYPDLGYKVDANLLKGTWKLVWTNDDITRSSPFFWAFRKAFAGVKAIDPLKISENILGTDMLYESIFKITDSIPEPVKSIGLCTQTFTESDLISQVEVKILGSASSQMTTTSKWAKDTEDSRYIEISVENTRVLESTISKFLPFLDVSTPFPSGAALELARPGSSTVYMEISYLDQGLRISRYEGDSGKIFIYERDY